MFTMFRRLVCRHEWYWSKRQAIGKVVCPKCGARKNP